MDYLIPLQESLGNLSVHFKKDKHETQQDGEVKRDRW